MRLPERIARLVLIAILGVLIGASARVMGDDEFHLLLGAGVLVLLITGRLVCRFLRPQRQELPWLEIEIAVAWPAFLLAWVACRRFTWFCAVDIARDGWLLTAVTFGILHGTACALYQQWRLPASAQCPNCQYSLIGLTAHRCPECGRPFTLQELQITDADLKPPPSPDTLEA